jgi:hypothetical protein
LNEPRFRDGARRMADAIGAHDASAVEELEALAGRVVQPDVRAGEGSLTASRPGIPHAAKRRTGCGVSKSDPASKSAGFKVSRRQPSLRTPQADGERCLAARCDSLQGSGRPRQGPRAAAAPALDTRADPRTRPQTAAARTVGRGLRGVYASVVRGLRAPPRRRRFLGTMRLCATRNDSRRQAINARREEVKCRSNRLAQAKFRRLCRSFVRVRDGIRTRDLPDHNRGL